MNKKLKLLTVSTLLVVTMSGVGCSLFDKEPEELEPVPRIESPETSIEEDNAAQNFIKNYFGDLFSKSAEEYSQNFIEGSIPNDPNDPNNLGKHIAARTLEEGDGNPEIGIHFPRFVEFGGLTMIDYKMMANDTGVPMVDAAYIGKTGDSFLYYVKVDVKATGMPINLFYKYYEQDENTMIFRQKTEFGEDDNIDDDTKKQLMDRKELLDKLVAEKDYSERNNLRLKIREIEEKLNFDEIKVQLKYDVEIIKENNAYKVLTQKEVAYKPSFKNRRFLLNNEFVDRLPYLDVNIQAENNIYQQEQKLIQDFFNDLLKLDRERMSLLRNEWDIGVDRFGRFLETVGINVNSYILEEETYKERFSILAFPLQVGMLRLIEYENLNITVHPGYSKNNKVYFVKANAIGESATGIIASETLKSSGVIEGENMYRYDYVVRLDYNNDGNLAISSIKLDEYLKIN